MKTQWGMWLQNFTIAAGLAVMCYRTWPRDAHGVWRGHLRIDLGQNRPGPKAWPRRARR